ncbi:MAG: heme-binding protein [Gammaproteobacteria bacterium]|nr:MAG: heme-binding protein [Gammaproteobacteria bacterium]
MVYKYAAIGLLLATIMSPMAGAEEEGALTTYRMLSPNTALELAQAAMASCRENGYQVAVTVVDRMGVVQVVLRDRFAGPHTPDTAWRKARTAVSFRTDTLSLSSLTASGEPQSGARFIPDTLMIGGGVPVESQGFIIGAIGVSGSPGGPQDDACARAAIKAIQDKLEF